MAETASTLDGVHLTNRYDLQFTFAATVPSFLCHERADCETGAYLMPRSRGCCCQANQAAHSEVAFQLFPTVCDQVPLSSKGMQDASLLV